MDRGLRVHLSVVAVVAIAGLPLTTARAQSIPLTSTATESIVPRVEAGTPTRVRESLWLLSTRRLPPVSADASQVSFVPDVWQFETGRGWVASSLDQLLLAGSQSTTANLFIHGNDTTAEDANENGTALYRQLRFDARPDDPQQFVIWSWPSAISGVGVRESAQINDLRTNIEGYYLARFLSRVSSTVPINIAGYCTGARIATGGLHLLGGGTLAGLRIANPNRSPPRCIHAILVAAGLANDWLLPGQPHGLALSQVDRLVITVNAVDPVLRWYPWIWGRGGPAALGMTGVPEPPKLGTAQTKIVQMDLTRTMQRRHSLKYYLGSPQAIVLLHSEMQGTRGSGER